MKLESQGGQKTALWGSKKRIIVYAGQYYDAETGLHYNYHRYYDPSLGRYLRADPIGLAGGVNLYAYVQNNPVNAIDPFGLKLRLNGKSDDRAKLQRILSNIAGTQLMVDDDGYISNQFDSPDKFNQVEMWLKEIINSNRTIDVQFGDAALYGGASFDMKTGSATLDYKHRECGQKSFYYRLEPENFLDWLLGGFLVGGDAQYFSQEGALSHELLGHGLDFIRGDYRNNQNDAINRANHVRGLLGIPLRYR